MFTIGLIHALYYLSKHGLKAKPKSGAPQLSPCILLDNNITAMRPSETSSDLAICFPNTGHVTILRRIFSSRVGHFHASMQSF